MWHPQPRTLAKSPQRMRRPAGGAHPRAAQQWVRERMVDPERRIGPRHFRAEHLRFYLSDWIERLTGARLFEFRNYEIV